MKYCDACRALKNAHARAVRARHKAEGQCIQCHKDSGGQNLCWLCRAQRNRRKRQKARLARERKAA